MLRTLDNWWKAFHDLRDELYSPHFSLKKAREMLEKVIMKGNPEGATVYRIARDNHQIMDIVDSAESVENFFRLPVFCGEFKWDEKQRGMNGRETYGEFRDERTGARLFYAVPHTVARY